MFFGRLYVYVLPFGSYFQTRRNGSFPQRFYFNGSVCLNYLQFRVNRVFVAYKNTKWPFLETDFTLSDVVCFLRALYWA